MDWSLYYEFQQSENYFQNDTFDIFNLFKHVLIRFGKIMGHVKSELTTNTNFPPCVRTLLNIATVAGMSGTQWRQENDVTAENDDLLEEIND